MRIFKRAIAFVSLLSLMGCGCIISYTNNGQFIIAGGVRTGAIIVYDSPIFAPLYLVDFPFSLAMDVLCLPASIPYTINYGEPPLWRPEPDSTPHGIVEGIVEGFVIQDEGLGYQVFPVEGWPLADIRPLAGATVKVFADPKDPELHGVRRITDNKGHYLLTGDWHIPWKVIRVELDGFVPVEIPVSKLHSPADQAYWGNHRLLIRMKTR
jgi:uncharacterized protein YceK